MGYNYYSLKHTMYQITLKQGSVFKCLSLSKKRRNLGYNFGLRYSFIFFFCSKALL